MADRTYGVLLLSFSRHGHQRNFVPLFQKHPRLRIVAVADEEDIYPELAALNRQWAEKLGVPYQGGVEQALAFPGVDLVSIAHEQERNAGLARRAAEAGKHLWIDKYIGGSLEECRQVAKSVARAGVKSIVPSYAYSQLLQQCRQVLAGGQLGRLLGVHAEVMFSKGWPRPLPDGPPGALLPPGRWTFPDLKRELLTVGAYAVGLIQEALGPLAWVQGRAGAFFFPEHHATRADDFGTMTLGAASGAIATLCGARIGVATHPQGGPLKAQLIGSRASALVDGKRPVLETFLRQKITEAQYRPPDADPMQWASGAPVLGASLAPDPTGLCEALEDLVQALDADRQPRYTVHQGRELMEILSAGYLSAAQGSQPVPLPLERMP
jgi:predicted dehydrogenase